MDRVDVIALAGIVILGAAMFATIVTHDSTEGQSTEASALRAHIPIGPDPALTKAIGQLRPFIDKGKFEDATNRCKALIARFPGEGEPHLLLGDIYLRTQQLMSALGEYKAAVDLNPDYLDKMTPAYQGKKIQHAVEEALREFEKPRLSQDTDGSHARDLRLVHYLQRKLAGACG